MYSTEGAITLPKLDYDFDDPGGFYVSGYGRDDAHASGRGSILPCFGESLLVLSRNYCLEVSITAPLNDDDF